jgi:MFS family permease
VPSPLESARLRRILLAYTVNRLGTWFGVVALMVAVYDHTHSALAVAALLLAWQALPAFVVPALVARVEASGRRHELTGLYLFEAVATASLAVLLWHFSLPALLVVAAADGTAALAASALLRAEVARAARDHAQEHLAITAEHREDPEGGAHEAERRANAALNVAFASTFVLGPVLGGAVVAAASASAALFIDVGSFVICGLLLIDLHPHVDEAGGDSVRARLRAAWLHINEAPRLRALLLVEAVAFIFFESGAPIEVTYAKVTLGTGAGGFGLLMGSWGAGALLGSLLFARMVRRQLAAMLSAGTLAVGMGYLGFAAAPSLALACLAGLVGGVGNGVELPALNSIVQLLTPPRLQGRLMGAVESLGALSLAIGVPLGGALVALSSPRAAFLVIGLGTAATSGALLVVLRGRLLPAARVETGAALVESAEDAIPDPAPQERAFK